MALKTTFCFNSNQPIIHKRTTFGNPFVDYFEHIYILSLKRATHRRDHMMNEMHKIECRNHVFIDAIDGKTVNLDKLIKANKLVKIPCKNRYMTQGEIGCLMSHEKAWMLIRDSTRPSIVIEDDTVFANNAKDILRNICHTVPADWDCIYFFSQFGINSKKQCDKYRKNISSHIWRGSTEGEYGGANCYAITPPAAQYLCDLVKDRYSAAADGVTKQLSINRNGYISSQFLCKSLKTPSMIGYRPN